jgi:hypothetical protein
VSGGSVDPCALRSDTRPTHRSIERAFGPLGGPTKTVAYRVAFMVEEFMLNGYVGIVSRRGLCQIQIERQDTLRRARESAVPGNKQPRVAFWAIIPVHLACQVFALVEQGEGKEALRVLNQVARDAGHLLPFNQ